MTMSDNGISHPNIVDGWFTESATMWPGQGMLDALWSLLEKRIALSCLMSTLVDVLRMHRMTCIHSISSLKASGYWSIASWKVRIPGCTSISIITSWKRPGLGWRHSGHRTWWICVCMLLFACIRFLTQPFKSTRYQEMLAHLPLNSHPNPQKVC